MVRGAWVAMDGPRRWRDLAPQGGRLDCQQAGGLLPADGSRFFLRAHGPARRRGTLERVSREIEVPLLSRHDAWPWALRHAVLDADFPVRFRERTAPSGLRATLRDVASGAVEGAGLHTMFSGQSSEFMHGCSRRDAWGLSVAALSLEAVSTLSGCRNTVAASRMKRAAALHEVPVLRCLKVQ